MSKGWKITLIVLGALLVGGCLFAVGLVVGRVSGAVANFFNPQEVSLRAGTQFTSPNKLFHSNFPGLGILQELRMRKAPFQTQPFREFYEGLPDVYQQGAPGDDPMGWTFDKRQGEIRGPGRLWRNPQGRLPVPLPASPPLSIEQAQKAAADFLAGLNNPDLQVSQVIVFDDHAAVFVVEKSTGIGALELLVEPITWSVFPEPGPSRRWNLKYRGLPGAAPLPDVSAEMPVSPEEAVKIAQDFLDTNLPGAKVDANAQPFYGFYTLLFMQDGKLSGMLSVNGFSRQVILHAWHGNVAEK